MIMKCLFSHGHRIGFVFTGQASFPVGLAAHRKFERAPAEQIGMGNVEFRIRFAIHLHALHVTVLVANPVGPDDQLLSIGQCHIHIGHVRRSRGIRDRSPER